jgi:phosphotransacetylase
MQPIFAAARTSTPDRSRIVYAEGEDERVLRAVQIAVDEKLATPILVGRPSVIERGIKRHGLRIRSGEHFTVVNPEYDVRYREYWQSYHRLTARDGVTAQYAKLEMRRRTTLIASMLLLKGEADGLICGTISTTARHLHYIDQVIGRRAGVHGYGAMSGLILPGRQVFIVDTHVNLCPSAAELAEIIELAAEQLCAFGLVPKVALLSHSNFGSSKAPSALKMRATLELLRTARQRQLAGVPGSGQRQHRLQSAQVRRGSKRRNRSHLVGLCRAGTHHDGRCDGPPHRQHDGYHGGGGEPRPILAGRGAGASSGALAGRGARPLTAERAS